MASLGLRISSGGPPKCAHRSMELQDAYLRGIYENLAEQWWGLAEQVKKFKAERGE
jgi:hypothetical protein